MDIVCFTIRRTMRTRRQWQTWRACNRNLSGVPRSASVWGKNWPKRRQSCRAQWKSECTDTTLENSWSISSLDNIYATKLEVPVQADHGSGFGCCEASCWCRNIVNFSLKLHENCHLVVRDPRVISSHKMVMITLTCESLNPLSKTWTVRLGLLLNSLGSDGYQSPLLLGLTFYIISNMEFII